VRGAVDDGQKLTILNLLVRVRSVRIVVKVLPHDAPFVDNVGRVASGYEVSDFPLGFLPRERPPKVPVESHT